MRSKGKVVNWHDDKGFGFIEPNEGGKQIFVHIKAFANRERRPVVGDIVTFSLSRDEQGRVQAVKATFPGEKLSEHESKRKGNGSTALTWIFFAIVGVSVAYFDLPILVLGAYATFSLVTFIAYAIDKWAAMNDRWRTSESMLHLLALLGGWPGALAAQQVLRHKSRKEAFRFVFWVTVIINCAVFAWLHTTDGQEWLNQAARTFL